MVKTQFCSHGKTDYFAQVEGGRVNSVVRSLREAPFLCVGFALYWVWLIITLQGPIRFPFYDLVELPLPSWAPTIIASALTCVLIAIFHERIKPIDKNNRARLVMALIMFLGLILSTFWVVFQMSPVLELFVFILGSLLMGIGSAGILLEFCRYYQKLGVIAILHHGAIAMLAATCYLLGLFSLNTVGLTFINMIINPLFPILIYFCFRFSSTAASRKNLDVVSSLKTKAIPGKVLLTSFIQGFAFGIGLGLLLFWGDYWHAPRFIGALCVGIAGALLLVTTHKLNVNFTHMIYLVGLPLIALGFFLMAFSSQLIAFGEAVQAIGACYQYIIMVCLFVYLTKVNGLPILRISGYGLAFLFFGQAAGGYLGSALAMSAPTGQVLSTSVSIVGVSILISALYISNSKRMEHGWEGARLGSGEPKPIMFEACVRILAAERNLTSRETEVLVLAAQGRNRKIISGELFISEETAKTHLRNIYNKLEVHSHQELIDLVHSKNP